MVYDILGNEIITLINEKLLPGEYEVIFDTETHLGVPLKSGIYFYKITVGSFSQTKKLILLK